MLKRPSFDPVSELATVIVEERDAIARLWGKRIRAELHEVQARRQDLGEPLPRLVGELGRLLRDRGEECLRLWPELVRAHGVRRYDLRYTPEDLGREFKALQQVILRVYVRRRGRLEPEVAELVADLVGEASAAVHSSYSRVLRTEEVRLRETATMESLLEHIDVGILLAEEDGHVSYVTPPVSRLIGLPGRVLVGSTAESMRAILTQLNARTLSGEPFRTIDLPFLRALREKQQVQGVVMVIDRHPDGREVILEMNALPVWEEGSDALYGAVMTLVDRTETTLRARELSMAYEQLRRLQGRLLQRTRAQALGQLASSTAHALNNFLNVLKLRVTLLRREYRPQYVESLDKSIGNVGELVSRLQDFAVPWAEEVDDIPVHAAVHEGVEQIRGELERGEAGLDVSLALDGDPRARMDANALRELTVNLLLWAKSRTPHGGTVSVRGEESEGWLELTFEDTGQIVPEEEVAYLFDPVKGRTSAPHLSLLLAVGRSQVQAAGGELWCANKEDGSGAICRVRLPVAQPVQRVEKVEKVEQPRPVTRRVGPRKVLVVDDDAENARMMAAVLTDEGYDVRVATSGDEALQMWSEREFDAALLDALMPDISGWGIARELRKRTPEALLAVVTGGDVRGQNRENLALVDAVFRKPVDVGALDEFLSQDGTLEGPQLPPTHTIH